MARVVVANRPPPPSSTSKNKQLQQLVRTGVVLAASIFVVLIAACEVEHRHCDYTETRCRTNCDYWCDYWGCYPQCYDQCWDECYVDGRTSTAPPAIAPPANNKDASSSSPTADGSTPAPTDGGTSGTRVLCSPCASNADCESGALCILRGGPSSSDASADGGASNNFGFCGHACQGAGDCPQAFTCTQIGSSKQCLPNAGACP